jgi:hypothetical protein
MKNRKPEKRDYWGAVEGFLQRINPLDVQSVACLAICRVEREGDIDHVLATYAAEDAELAKMAGLLLHYSLDPIPDDEEGEDETDVL